MVALGLTVGRVKTGHSMQVDAVRTQIEGRVRV